MATQKQIEANRRNAQKSTGPKTEAGKQKSKFNALKHGMTARVAVLPHEDKLSYEELRQSTIESYQPANGAELMLVDLIAINYWRLLRARRVETATMDLHIRAYKTRHGVSVTASMDDDSGIATAFADPKSSLGAIDRYQTTVERSYLRAVDTLRKLQNDRLRRERQNGFVPRPAASQTQPESPGVYVRSKNFELSSANSVLLNVGRATCTGDYSAPSSWPLSQTTSLSRSRNSNPNPSGPE
jgi:hypothetical protein